MPMEAMERWWREREREEKSAASLAVINQVTVRHRLTTTACPALMEYNCINSLQAGLPVTESTTINQKFWEKSKEMIPLCRLR